MSITLVSKYCGPVDEMFKAESKLELLTNTDYDWTGAHSIQIYKISTIPLQDYARNRRINDEDDIDNIFSRYGNLYDLDAVTEEKLLSKDRSFIFNVDRLDEDETAGALNAGTALERQVREVVIPEVDAYVYGVMVANAGHKADASELNPDNIYDAIIAGTEALDDSEVPDTKRVLLVTPATYRIMKQSPEINLECDISEDMRLHGVVAMVDGMTVVKVPASRLPEGFGFLIAHPYATTAAFKLTDYHCHTDTPLSSGTIVTGRIAYDAFVLDNKKVGIYYHPIA